MKLKLKKVRLAFPQLWEAKTVNGEGKPSFSAALLIDPMDPQIAEINKAITATAGATWGQKAEAILKQMRAADKVCLHDGDLKSTYDGFAGMFYISARSYTRPSVFDRDKTPLLEADGKPYAGCYVNAVLELWAQDNNYGKRINASLSGIQFDSDGDSFTGGGSASEEEFDDLTTTTEEDLI